MPIDPRVPSRELAPLQPLVGEWTEEVKIGDALLTGRVVFEWALDGRYLVQRSEAPHPVPDSLAIIALDAPTGGYTQHYFDSRGVVRLYRMSLRDGVWTLVRDAPDFTPLSFSQRFTGTFAEDGTRIDARWEKSSDGGRWERDFDLSLARRA